jgi:hypothetical protein
VVLANSTRGVATLGRHILAPDVVGIEHIPPQLVPTYQPTQPINLDRYVGSYRAANGSRLVVENRNGELIARMNKEEIATFRPIGEDLFLVNEHNARFRFKHDSQGRVTTLILEQEGHVTPYPREP